MTRPSRILILSAAYIILSVVNVILSEAEDLKRAAGCSYWLRPRDDNKELRGMKGLPF